MERLTQTQITKMVIDLKAHIDSLNFYTGVVAEKNATLGLIPTSQIDDLKFMVKTVHGRLSENIEQVLSPVVVPNLLLPGVNDTVISSDEDE